MQEKELKYIAEHYQTPCFIFDLEAVKERVKKMREIVGCLLYTSPSPRDTR